MQGKVVLVTGGAKRVGAAICRRLHAAGANIALHYRASLAEAQALQAELNLVRDGSVMLCQADLLDLPSLPVLVAQVVEQFGKLDGIVNNASSFYPTPLASIDLAQWHDLIGSNLQAPLFLAQAAADELRRNHGSIVNIVDIHADRPMQGHLIYNIAKTGLRGLTLALAQELAPHVRVNGVSPGAILWPSEGDWKDIAKRAAIIDHTLLKREGEPNDIARTVVFLMQDAPYITGQIIAVDGGRSICL